MRNIIAAATGVMVLLGLFLCYLLTKKLQALAADDSCLDHRI